MKYVLLLLALGLQTRLWAQGSASDFYLIQIASVASPQTKDFDKIKNLGYVFEERQHGKALSRVMMGGYTSQKEAKTVLQKLKAQGFRDAFLSVIPTREEDEAFIVQLAVYKASDDIPWQFWLERSPNLCVQVADGQLRLCSGPYPNREIADKLLPLFQSRGADDAFVKRVSRRVFHIPTTLEMSRSASFNGGSKSRNSLLALQKVLKAEGFYQGSEDGLSSETFEQASQNFKTQNHRYANYARFSETDMSLRTDVKDYSLQYYFNLVPNKPYTSEQGFKQSNAVLAKAFLAYLYLHGDVPHTDPKGEATRLMHQALDAALKKAKQPTRHDYRRPYFYDDLKLWAAHLRDLWELEGKGLDLPCWLFRRHPEIFSEAFAPFYGNARDAYGVSVDCGSLSDLPSFRILWTAQNDLLTKKVKPSWGQLNLGYVLPALPDATAAQGMENWYMGFWNRLGTWAQGNAARLSQYQTLYFCFHDALLVLEQAYEERGFTPFDARCLALQVLHQACDAPLSAIK